MDIFSADWIILPLINLLANSEMNVDANVHNFFAKIVVYLNVQHRIG